jgi:uncharacterized membrane protein YeaQ/YmgE (transglycosylase-associated protein family)
LWRPRVFETINVGFQKGENRMDILSWIVIGLIAGWLTSRVMKGTGFGLIGDTIVGVVGALLGGFVASQVFKIPNAVSGFNLETLGIAFLGSIVVIYVLRYLPSLTRHR